MQRILLVAVVALAPARAHAWAIGSQINETGCHEPITAQALRDVRAQLPAARGVTTIAPAIAPTRDEAALIDDVLFAPPSDFAHDLAGMTLLLGVRDNDLKGINPLASLDLVQVHGNPDTQDEHCIRGPNDDGADGDASALAACRAFIVQTATAALAGLDANGAVDASVRMPLEMYLAVRGHAEPMLPLFYVKMGAAMHALEDGFTHTYRAGDDVTRVTTVLNWIDLVDGKGYDEARDGPPHRAELDHCWHADPTIERNMNLATMAAGELLAAALDPTLAHDDKVARFDAITVQWLTFAPGCTADNKWCDPPEAKVMDTNPAGCSAGGGAGWLVVLLVIADLLVLRRSRRATAGAVVVLACVTTIGTAYADDPPPPLAPTTPATVPVDPAHADAPGVPVDPKRAPVEESGAPQKEPGRDVETPTVAEVQKVREAKELGSPLGFTAVIGGAVDRTAAVASVGLRYRLNERWLVGIDGGWNPWITTSPMRARAGVATAYLTLIRRFPMKFDRVNLRTSAHAGVSTLLFDVYGAPMYSTGPYVALCPLGIDYDLGNHVRLVFDPFEFALPVPLVGQLPLYYEQFRVLIGIQIGA